MTDQLTAMERCTAIELEARHRGVSYGQLVPALSFEETDRIVNTYMAKKRGAKQKKKQACKGCSYWVQESCSFHLNGRLRRRDVEGLCMEHTTDQRIRRKVRKNG